MKIALIDSTCTTHLSKQIEKISIPEIAAIIKESEFDKFISSKFENKNPETIVEIILKKIYDKYSVKPFSFVTKYCCYHSNICYERDDFSIYDSKVKENLGFYILNKEDYATEEEYKEAVKTYGDELESQYKNKLKYIEFNNIIKSILENNKIKLKYKRRYFDYYLWWNAKNNNEDSENKNNKNA